MSGRDAAGTPGEVTQSIDTHDVLFVVEGDPPASLFQIPSHYTERTPSKAAAGYARRFPGHSIFPERTAKLLDNVYSTSQGSKQLSDAELFSESSG